MRLFFLLFFTTFCSLASAQDKTIATFIKNLEGTTNKSVQEKVHLHLDKPYYAVGDDIWFKAYTLNAKTGLPSDISSVLYVELINEKDFITKQLKLRMVSGITWGDFKLPDSLQEGNYRIRAYTQWMRNAGPEFFFDKTIKIGNSWANNVFTKVGHTITTENGQRKVVTTIQFTDKYNSPYAGNEISYQVKLGSQIAHSGKGTTNNLGEITLNINYKQTVLDNSSFIVASIKMPNTETVDKQIPLIGIAKDIDIQFLPEGGSFIENLPNKIAIKTIGSNGLGLSTAGKIYNKNGAEVGKFETNKLGMGSFMLVPLTNETYTAKIQIANAAERTVKLPIAEKSGTVLTINNLEPSVMGVKIYLSEDLLNKDEYYLMAQKNGVIYFSKKIAANKSVVSLTVPKNNFPSGVLTLTLFSSNLLPLNERVIFVNNLNDKIAIEPENLQITYQARQKVDLSLLATNNKEAIQGSFSVAVTNTTAVKADPENETNILTSLLLKSDLVGYIEKPNYYFLNNDKKTIADLDDLLLTQGWRKMIWKDIKEGVENTTEFPAEKTLQISGTVTKGGKPVVNGKITLASLKGTVFAADTVTDENGRFIFDKIELSDTLRYVLQARTEKDRKFVTITLDLVPEQNITRNPNTGDIEVNVNQTMLNYLKESNKYLDDQTKRGFLTKTIQLNQVNIVKKRPTSKQWEELSLPGIIDKSISAKELEKVSMLSTFLPQIMGIQVINGQPSLLRRGSPLKMVIFIDGLRYNDNPYYHIDDIDVEAIQSIEILRQSQGYAFGVAPDQGVIVITTKYGLGLSARSSYIPGLIKSQLVGYNAARIFYSPQYDVKPDDQPDLRTTVLWEPQIISDADGKIKLKYYNTDVPGTYRIVIEGIDGSGNLARKVLTYEVK